MEQNVPGTPAWYFHTLTTRLAARQSEIDLLDAYYHGNHPLPKVLPGVMQEFRRIQSMCRANWMQPVVNAPANKLRIIGVRRGRGQDGLDAGLELWDGWWQPNGMDKVQRQVFRRALSCKRSYMMVQPNPVDGMSAAITVESPREVIVAYEPGSTTKRVAGLKSFHADGWRYQVLATRDAVYRRKVKEDQVIQRGSTGPVMANWEPWWPDVTDTVQTSPEDPMLVGEPNPLGEVPFIEVAANQDDEGNAASELEAAIPIQDRINHTILNRVFTTEYQSWPIRVVIGEKLREDPDGNIINPLRSGPDRVSTLENPNAKLDSFQPADIKPFLEAVRADVMELASITQTPPHLMIGEIVNVSADALRALREGLIDKVLAHQDDFADPFEEVLRLAMKADGADGADDESLEVLWDDPAKASLAERADAAMKLANVLPRRQIWSDVWGMSPQQVEQAQLEEDIQQAASAFLAPPPVAAVPPVPPAAPVPPVPVA